MLQQKATQSMLSKNNISIKRNKSLQILIPSLPDIQKYDTNKLFEQFKRHLLKQYKKQLNKHTNLSNGYKKLLCDTKKCNQQKKLQLSKLHTKLKTTIERPTTSCRNIFNDIKNVPQFQQITQNTFKLSQSKLNLTNCKFKPIRPMTTDAKFRISANKSRLLNTQFALSRLIPKMTAITSPNSKITKIDQTQQTRQQEQIEKQYGQKPLSQISQQILMVQVQQAQLEQEIISLKQSLNKLKKQLQTVNKQMEIQARNQQKYKHISYLANSIKNQTDYIKFQNCKGYHNMASRQDDTISQLKKFKTNLRKQKDQMQTVYIQDINHWVQVQQQKNASKKREFLFSSTSTPSKQNQQSKSPHQKFQLLNKTKNHPIKSTHLSSKSMKKLIDQFDTIIYLLQENQSNFEEIKQRQCTRVRLGKINKALLPKQRVQVLERIEQFEQKYDMKIGSIQNLILSVYHTLFNENKSLESQCLKLTQTKQQFQEDLKQIVLKHQTDIQTFQKHYRLMAQQQHQRRKMNELLKKNSRIFLKVVQGFYTMLFKFRYMFSLALTLDIDKKSFRDCVIQIDSCFSSGLFFNFSYQKHLITSSQRHDIINEKQFKDILLQKRVDPQLSTELTQILFNDHRINLIMHKSWIQNRFKYLFAEEILQSDILDIIQSVRIDCQQIYKMKVPSLASLFLTCYKSISMSKYETKLAASSGQRGSIFLPTGPTKKFHYLQMDDQNNQSYQNYSDSSTYEPSKKKITFATQNSSMKEDSVFEKDPRKIIYHLQQIKNKNHKKFKALNFTCEGKSYKYNEQIVIPDFPMINKGNQFDI